MYKTEHAFTYLLLKEIVANERLISVWCELDHSGVNHAIDEWRHRLSATRPVSTLKADILNIRPTYDCYS